uniref:CAAX prenyl protease 2/Lysostaphin resistance protein A-like domain-containing protein n=1 Tax=mine drainage metagenome TaxID=410659 RepID=E6QIR6_9ZZZZ
MTVKGTDRRRTEFTRARAASGFLLSGVVFMVARLLAEHSARGFASSAWEPLIEQGMLAFLLLIGFAALGMMRDSQLDPVAQQGLAFRAGWRREAGLGVGLGWALALVCLLPMALGGMAVHFSVSLASFGWLVADGIFFALATLAVTIAFQGYPLQALLRAIGEPSAALLMAILYGLMQMGLPGASRASMAMCFVFGLMLAIGYLRTRALWVPWGLHFGWVASQALLFGLPVNGITSHSPVVQSYPMGSYFFSGGDFGLDGSWFAVLVMVAAMPVLFRATRDLSFVHNAPVIVPGGVAVDLDAAAKRQHEAATRPEAPEVKPLVQILPAVPATGSIAYPNPKGESGQGEE